MISDKILPSDSYLSKYVDHYWLVRDAHTVFQPGACFHEFPSLSPELVIIIDGQLSFEYKGQVASANQSVFFSFIDERITFYPGSIKSFIIVKFHDRALSSLLPFVRIKASDLIKSQVFPATSLFPDIDRLAKKLQDLNSSEIGLHLDDWLLEQYNGKGYGFIDEMAEENDPSSTVRDLIEQTNYSYSTIERYFRNDTGLNPKKFLSMLRFKRVIEEINDSANTDWFHYIEKYNFHDQNHFIKEVKKYSHFTPGKLLSIPSLMQIRGNFQS